MMEIDEDRLPSPPSIASPPPVFRPNSLCLLEDDRTNAEEPLSSEADGLSPSLKRHSSEPIAINLVGRCYSLPSAALTPSSNSRSRCSTPDSRSVLDQNIRSRNSSGHSTPSSSHQRIGARRVSALKFESNPQCSTYSELASEKLLNLGAQVSNSLEDFCIDERQQNERKRAKSLTEPISIVTHCFLPASCSPSPTRAVDHQKQCYSPSAQQIVRHNIAFSPSPSPTPSPTRRGLLRSLSPIAVRPLLGAQKRKAESDPYPVVISKRFHPGPVRSSTGCRSPLVPDKDIKFPPVEPGPVLSLKHSFSLSVSSLDSESSNSESTNSDFTSSFVGVYGRPNTPGFQSFGSFASQRDSLDFGRPPEPPSGDFERFDAT